MSKKIGLFLMIVLVIWSVLLLDATKNRKPPRIAPQPPQTTEEPVPESSSEAVPPETTIPAPVITESPEPSRVDAVLDRYTMNETAVTYLVRRDGAADSQTADLAELASRRKMNPIAAFWVLVSEEVYERGGDRPGLPPVSLTELPSQPAKRYDYTNAGAKQLMTDLLTLAGGMESGIAQAVVGENGAVSPEQVYLSDQDDCWYAYFAYTTDRSTQILCFYLRADAKGEQIADVEFQLLHMTLGAETERGDEQAAVLAAAVELLMTGTARVGEGESTASYEVGGWTAKAERFFFTGEEERGTLTNYRLRK